MIILIVEYDFPTLLVSFLVALFTNTCKNLLILESITFQIYLEEVHKKVKDFVWTSVLEKINTADNLQVQCANIALLPKCLYLCYRGGEIDLHLFFALSWQRLFGLKGELVAYSASLLEYM